MKKYILGILVLLLTFAPKLKAQDRDTSMFAELDNSAANSITLATFKTTRIVNMHTIETLGKRTLDFRISHRFGNFNSGAQNFYGLDGGASIRLGFEYSHNGRLMGGIGRTSTGKMFDGFLKYRWLRQTDNNRMPLSVTLLACMYLTHEKDALQEINKFDKYAQFTNRMSYNYEIIIGRKFSPNFSLQIAPYFLHYNLVEKITDLNDSYGVQGGLRYKVTKRSAITMEYALRINDYSRTTYYNSFGIGYEIETGGHVFQVHLTNSFGIVENQFLAYTTTQWNNAGIRLGFNISRVFTL